MVVRDVLAEHGLRGYPKTSGSKGIHVNVRVEPLWDSLEVRRAALALAREVERRAPDLATSKWWKEERHGVFVDYNQNARDRTVASCYSVRPTPDARVSCALAWDEVPDVEPGDLRLDTVPDRLRTVGDPAADIDVEPGSLDQLLELARRDEEEGLGDAPWPPHFPKQRGEPKRVQPSRDRDRPTHRGRAGDPQPGGPPPGISTGGLQRGFGSKPRTGQGYEHEFRRVAPRANPRVAGENSTVAPDRRSAGTMAGPRRTSPTPPTGGVRTSRHPFPDQKARRCCRAAKEGPMKAPRAGLMAALALAVLTLSSGSAYAAAGDLDPTFDGDGKRVLPFAGIPNEALVQPDGKIVLAGFDELHEFAVWRLNPDGSLDRSFDGDGTVAISFGLGLPSTPRPFSPTARASSPAAPTPRRPGSTWRSRGSIRTGRWTRRSTRATRTATARRCSPPRTTRSATAVVVQPDGRILLAGAGTGVGAFSLTRLDSKGAVDGTVFEDPPGFRYELAADMSLQANGTIVGGRGGDPGAGTGLRPGARALHGRRRARQDARGYRHHGVRRRASGRSAGAPVWRVRRGRKRR